MVPCRPHLVSLGRIERRKWDLLNSRCRQRARQDRCHHCRQGLPFLHGGTSLGPNGGICAHTTAVDAITCGCSTRNLLPPSWRQFFFVFVGNSEIRAFFSLCPRVTLRLGWAWREGPGQQDARRRVSVDGAAAMLRRVRIVLPRRAPPVPSLVLSFPSALCPSARSTDAGVLGGGVASRGRTGECRSAERSRPLGSSGAGHPAHGGSRPAGA